MKNNNEVNRKTLSWLLDQPVDVKTSMAMHHLELSRMLINEILNDEVECLAGKRYKHQPKDVRQCYRWSSNPGSVKLGGQRIPVEIPRVVEKETKRSIPLENYAALKDLPPANEQLIKAVLLGLSTGDYGKVIQQLTDSFGLSSSSVSRNFIDYSAEKLKEFERRDLSGYDFVSLFIDGKYLAKEQIIITLGVTAQGDKVPLGFIQSATENSKAIKQSLEKLIDRGLEYKQGLLCVVDGSKGIKKALEETFGHHAVLQRCRWHKTENVVSYLKEQDQQYYRRKLQTAYREDDYRKAHEKLQQIKTELEQVNVSAANSLCEGMQETLTLQKLGINQWFSKSFGTTNCIENLNSQLGKYIRKVKYWQNSPQRYRWVAAALLEIEQKMRKVDNCKKLYLMENAIIEYVSNKNTTKKVA